MKKILLAILVLVPMLTSPASAATTFHLFIDRDRQCVIAQYGTQAFRQLLASRQYNEISAHLRTAAEARGRAERSGCRSIRRM